MVSLLPFLILASDIPVPVPSIWSVAAQSGFNAILVLLLLYYGRSELSAMRKSNEQIITDMRLSNEKVANEIRRSQDRNTKMVTVALLQFAALVPGAKGQLQSLKDEIEQVERDDAKPT